MSASVDSVLELLDGWTAVETTPTPDPDVDDGVKQ